MRALRIGVCLLAILVILIMGRIGEEVLGLARVLLAPFAPQDLGAVTAFVIQNYRTNQNHFLLSLVPFLAILAAMPFLDRVVARWDARFWYAFAGVGLAFMIYLCAFVYALAYPFTHLGLAADHEATIVTYATAVLVSLLIAALIGLYVRAPAESQDLRFRDARKGDEAAVQAVVARVLKEYGLAADPAATDADLADLTASYFDRGGVFRVLVSDDGTIVGCGGLYPVAGDEFEIRKMYFVPQVRGRGHGRRLLEELIEGARQRGCKRVVLETASVLKEAIALYRSFGFRPFAREQLACRCDQAMALEL